MRRPVLLIAAVSALVLAGTAVAGGWATVKLSSRPTGLAAGETWVVDITVLQHGVTPLAGVKPTLTIRKVQRTLSAAPTGNPVAANISCRSRTTARPSTWI